MISIEEAKILVKETLSEKRYNHSICVMERCAEYAKDLNVDVEKAKLMGILHDIAKEMSSEEKIQYCLDNNIEIEDIERVHITLLHGKIAAHMAKEKYGLDDELVSAIKYHTTRKENMSIWEKILYVADTTSADRKYSNTEYFYNLSKENFEKALIEILIMTIKDRLEEKKMIHIDSINALNYLIKQEK